MDTTVPYFASTPMFFSARHSEAQAAHRPGTDGRDDSPYNDFETAVHRLEQFRRGHIVSANGGNREMHMNGDGYCQLGFSSKFGGELAGLVGEERTYLGESSEQNDTSNNLDEVGDYKRMDWKACNEDVATKTRGSPDSALTSGQQNEHGTHRNQHRNSGDLIRSLKRESKNIHWIKFWLLIYIFTNLWDLCIICLTNSLPPLPLAYHHSRLNETNLDSIPGVFATLMLNVSYLFLEHVIGWPPALLIAFASGMFTFGQNISSLIQIYGSSSSLVPVVAVVLFRAVIPMIVCAVTGNWLSHRLEHR